MSARIAVQLLFIISFITNTGLAAEIPAAAQDSPPARISSLPDRYPPFLDILREQADRVAAVLDDQGALALFQEIGPRIGLKDAAVAVAAKNIPPSMAKELVVEDVRQASVRLVKGLAVWLLAMNVRAASENGSAAAAISSPTEAHAAWLNDETEADHPARRLVTLVRQQITAAANQSPSAEDKAAFPPSAAAAESWARDQVNREWFRLYNWKDTVRRQRALARLCGTWQWTIHNHQNHREDKTSIIFAPPGADTSAGPAEIIAVGDLLYLRWETRAGVQEDSLLFTGEGQRLEGTFVNSIGGWGSITGKQTTSCAKASGEKPASAPRRHH